MATQLQIRRGTNSQVAAFTGAEGEIVVNTTNDSVHVNDGSTAGGFELARVDGSNWAITNAISTTANISFGDNDKAIFGAGSDLQIYHDGSDSYVSEQGTGNLQIQAQNLSLEDSAGTRFLLGIQGGETRLYNQGNEKVAVTTTGIDVTGTVTATKLVSENGVLELDDNGTHNGVINVPASLFINIDSDANNTGEDFVIGKDRTSTSGGTELFRVQEDGNVGLGTSSPASLLHLSATAPVLSFTDTNSFTDPNDRFIVRASSDKGNIQWYDDSTSTTSELMTFLSSGEVGIGTTSPSQEVHVKTTGSQVEVVLESSGQTSSIFNNANAAFGVLDGSTERMRISGGNLLVGKTSAGQAIVGCELRADRALVTRDGGTPLTLNRLTSDGNIVELLKDGTTVGSIKSRGGEFLAIGYSDTYLEFNAGSDQINPSTGSAARDNAIDLGSSGARFDDIFATNGTIQTSDRNEKQDIEELSDAEQRVAVAAKGLLRKFRWINSVEAKGDEARIHFGIIAQDLQDAFTAEGLDAGRYAMFISSTWTDEDGNEQTRLGVRYSELLAFIISAI